MKHLIICPEYPPAPIAPGGIGTYVVNIAQLLADAGETVHIITQRWLGASKYIEEKCHGRLIIHRVSSNGSNSLVPLLNRFDRVSPEAEYLSRTSVPSQGFSWQAALLAEQLVESEGIDLIEAQEYGAPLYYFQLRRALGLGPKQTPPCLVHLHSPTEFIINHNGWDIAVPSFLTAKRLEDYSIQMADALLCPSQYMARQAESHYDLAPNSIQVIPLPIGDTPWIERDAATWEQGSIAYVGRLERRKGVLEWIDAAVSLADRYPTVHFDFIGHNCLSTPLVDGDAIIQRRIPKSLKPRFRFHGKQERSLLPLFLKQARMAVVPSRWENFPNTCVEAMSSGLPVITSPEGGMVEMVEDGYTGWVSDTASPESLAIALQRALETPAEVLAEMGERASARIREICNNQLTLQQHLEFRQKLVLKGATRSLHVLGNQLAADRALPSPVSPPKIQLTKNHGIALIITGWAEKELERCVQSVLQQSQPPVMVCVVGNSSLKAQIDKHVAPAQRENWTVVTQPIEDEVGAKNLGLETVLALEVLPLGIAFLSSTVYLHPQYVERCQAVLQHSPEVGLVSFWVKETQGNNCFWIKPCPQFPYQWISNDVAPCSVIRTAVFKEIGRFRTELAQGYEDWDCANAALAASWAAVTFPGVLATASIRKPGVVVLGQVADRHAICRMQRALLERFPQLVARDGMAIALLSEPNPIKFLQQEPDASQGTKQLSQLLLYSLWEDGQRFIGAAWFRIFQVKQLVKRLLRQAAIQNLKQDLLIPTTGAEKTMKPNQNEKSLPAP